MPALVLDRAVRTPVADGRKRVASGHAGGAPVLEDDRRQGPDPVAPPGRHRASTRSEREADRGEVRVTAEAHVDAGRRLPELVEGRIEVEVHTHGDRRHEL